jgi:hypothetical protein
MPPAQIAGFQLQNGRIGVLPRHLRRLAERMEAADLRNLLSRPTPPGLLPSRLRPITRADRQLREAMGDPIQPEHTWMWCVLDGNPGIVRKPLSTERAVALIDDLQGVSHIDAELLP